jgi:GAF domain-containing protein
MAGQYVLPSLIPDEDDMDASMMLAQLSKRSSSTSQEQQTYTPAILASPLRSNFSVVPSMRVSSRSSRSGSYSSRPPSSFRAFKTDSDTTSNSSHALPSPSIRKRTSSLTLDARVRANHQKALPSTPISATPSLTFSHSRTESRSDASTSSPLRYSPEYHRHSILDYSRSFDALDQLEEQWAQLQDGASFASEPPVKDEYSFLPTAHDGIVSDVLSNPSRKKTVAFKSRSQRNPDKVAQMLGEDYKEGNRRAVQGQLGSQSTVSLISPSKASFKALFSSVKGRMRKEDSDPLESRESMWERERRLEEKREKQEMRRLENQARVLEMVSEFSTVRPHHSRKEHVREKGKSKPFPDKGKDKARDVSSETTSPGEQQSVFHIRKADPLRISERNTPPRQQRQRKTSSASIADGSFLRLQEGASSDSEGSDGHGERTKPKPVKKSQSIDALYAMLQPCVQQQQELSQRSLSASTTSALIQWPKARKVDRVSLAEIRRKLQNQANITEEKAATDPAPLNESASVQKGEDLLPPLTSHLAQCLALNRKELAHPWKSEKTKLLTASSPREAVPKSWSGYIRAYARGDFDLNNPPAPRSAPLVNRAVPRASPLPDCSSPTMPGMLGSSWSPYGSRARMASKESLQSLNMFYDLPAANSSKSLSPLTPPPTISQSSLRDRLPSPRFVLRKSQSGEQVNENMRLPRDDEDEVRVQAEELAAVGGMGDIKGPRPTWEAERSASARNYLHEHYHQTSPRLQTIVERLSRRLNASYASVQILVADESIVLASSGLDEEIRATFTTSPQMDCIAQGGSDDIKIMLRDDSLDAHTILQRDGAPFVVVDLSKDWRFEKRGAVLPFYAGASLFASDTGLPIGTVSVMHHRAKDLTREERDVLVQTAREMERELQQMQSRAVEKELQQLDDGILGWISLVQTNAAQKTTKASKKLSVDFAFIDASLDLSVDPSLAYSFSAPSSEEMLSSRLSSALQTILSALQVEYAYIARVGSDPLQCQMQSKQELGVYRAGEMKLDAALHLCALAAHKSGLHFDNDEENVRILMGEVVAKEDEAAGIPHFTSARVVACGLKEGGKAHRGTEGWVLGVASRSNGRLDAASGVYLIKFATLIAPLLLQGPRSPQWQRKRLETSPERQQFASGFKERSPGTPFYVSAQSSPLPYVNRTLPSVPQPPLRSGRKRLPLVSPPPGAPLPLPPVPVLAASAALRQSTRTASNERSCENYNRSKMANGLQLEMNAAWQ